MLAVVLLVMVGEEAQEIQLARWLPDENSAAGTCNSILDGTVVLYIPHCRNTERPLAGLIVFGSCIAANIGGEKCERSIIPRPLRHFEVFEKHNQTLGISTGRDSNLGKNESQLSLSLR